MDNCKELFRKFKENKENANLEVAKMYGAVSKQEWGSYVSGSMHRLEEIFKDNTLLFEKLEIYLSKKEKIQDADEIYDMIMSMYREGYSDYRWLLPVIEHLIPYYDERSDYEKLLYLYMIGHYYENEIKNKQLGNDEYDVKYLRKVIEKKTEYAGIKDSNVRLLIWKAYYDWIIIGLDREKLNPKDAFSLYDEMEALWMSEPVQELDGNIPDHIRLIDNVRENLTDSIYLIDMADEMTKNRFAQIAKDNYVRELHEKKSKFEVDPILFASYLYVLYQHGQETLESIFDEILDCFQYGYQKYKKEEELGVEALIFFSNVTRILHKWSEKGLDATRTKKLLFAYVTLIETPWKKVDEKYRMIYNELFGKLGSYIIDYEGVEIEAEKCVYNTVLKPNICTYINAEQVTSISKILFEESYELMPSLYAKFVGMGHDELLEFVINCARLHDIAIVAMVPFLYQNGYPVSRREQEVYQDHPVRGAKYVEKSDKLRKYKDVILGHHKHYDGKGGFPENYDNTLAFYRVIVDIIFLADQIAGMFDPFSIDYLDITFEEMFEELRRGKGTKYNPFMIEILENSSEIQDKIRYIVTDGKEDVMYSYYQDIENVLTHQSENEIIFEAATKMQEIEKTGKTEEAVPYLDRMFEYASREHSDKMYGFAYCYSMFYHTMKEEYLNAINCGMEAIRFFEKIGDSRLLSSVHNSLALNMQCQGSPENGIGHFLQAGEYASIAGNPFMQGSAYSNLACVFNQLELYEKALEYIDIAIDAWKDMTNYLLIAYLNKSYACIHLQETQMVKDCQDHVDELKKMVEDEQDYSSFVVNIYEAYIAHYLGNKEKLEKCLTAIADDLTILRDYRLHVEEINIYLELLKKLGKKEELIRQLDVYIAYCRKNHLSHYIFNVFLQERILCAYEEKDYQTTKELSLFMKEMIAEQLYNQADVTLQIENNIIGNMKLQQTRREMIVENEELEQKVKEERNASEAKIAFLSSMSHEIRTPIHAVIGLNEMILRESKDDSITQYARDIQAAGQNLLRIVNDVLDFSKMEAGKVEILPQEYRMSELLESAYREYAPKAASKKLTFQIICDPAMPDLLYGDDDRIYQILDNLITNAIKYTHKGGVTLQVTAQKINQKAIGVQFHVKDTGIGIKEAEIDKMIKPFERADEDRNKSIEGIGLGLAIVGMLLQKMNGKMSVDSTYGKGSEFTVQMIQEVRNWQEIGNIDFHMDEKEHKVLYAPAAKILVVDDNLVNLKVVTSLLKRTGIQTITATSGKECLEKVHNEEVHLILLDHQMPGMDGIETLKEFKKDEKLSEKIPVIALTANTGANVAEYYKKEGFVDYISKPVNYVMMEEKLYAYLPKEILNG